MNDIFGQKVYEKIQNKEIEDNLYTQNSKSFHKNYTILEARQ